MPNALLVNDDSRRERNRQCADQRRIGNEKLAYGLVDLLPEYQTIPRTPPARLR